MNTALEKLRRLQAEAPQIKAALSGDIRPRQYASHICSLTTREDRLKALMSVPKEWQDLVKKHVEIYFERKKYVKT